MSNRVSVRQLNREFKSIVKRLPVIITVNGKDTYKLSDIKDEIIEAGFNGDTGYIYLLKVNDYYKLGRTNQFERRLKQFETYNPYKIEVILKAKVDTCEGIEAHLLDKFSDKQVKGEWFKLDNADIEEIKSFLDTKKPKVSDKPISNPMDFCPKHPGSRKITCGCP